MVLSDPGYPEAVWILGGSALPLLISLKTRGKTRNFSTTLWRVGEEWLDRGKTWKENIRDWTCLCLRYLGNPRRH